MNRRPKTSNSELNQVINFITESFAQLLADCPILRGVLLEDVNLTTSDTLVNHTLTRVPIGYLVVSKDANAAVYTSSTSNLRPKEQLILKASATVEVDLWVF